ncbi:MAG: aldolase catalytic domain-containing protein [Anaeroplasmataceae bacterium]|nr:aldolase catalytic domain-containing protein [Anaeroplasmataceae bacterium]
MGTKSLLDCTLRDGGYVNDWDFGHDNLISIFERLVDSRADIIEVGFIDGSRPYDCNRSIFPDTESVERTFGLVKKSPPMVVGMIDYGTCPLENIQPCVDSFLDGIRVIFKKQKMHDAMMFCRQLKGLGYKVFSQLVSITAYDDADLLELISLVNDVKPYAVSMVDTYGLLDPSKMLHYYKILDENTDPSVKIGFHAHNNFQLAYANTMAFLEKETTRDIVADGTLFGMGKSAGNAPLELVAMFMNDKYNASYDTQPMLEAIGESIKPFFTKSPWGYKMYFYLSASNECHPNYVQYLQSKENLSVSKVDELLSRIEPVEKKLLYDAGLAERLYQDYILSENMDDASYDKLRSELEGKTVLLIGPGKNIRLQSERVKKYIDESQAVTISINYLPDAMVPNYVFLTKANRYKEMSAALLENEVRTIATSNIECRNGKFDCQICRAPLLEQKEEIKDNPFLMLLKVLKKIGVKNIACAGLDGYSDKEDNYAVPEMEYDFVKQAAAHLNRHIRRVITEEYGDLNIDFITYSHYTETEDVDSARF